MSDVPAPGTAPTAAAAAITADDVLAEFRFDSNGLIPAIAQDAVTNEILMVAWMDEAAFPCALQAGAPRDSAVQSPRTRYAFRVWTTLPPAPQGVRGSEKPRRIWASSKRRRVW